MAAADHPLDEIVPNSEPEPTSQEQEEWFGSLENAIRESEDGQNKASRRQHRIQRVARVLRTKDCFEPIAVSIGPYHRNKPDLEPMEKLKAPMMGQYVKALGRPKEWLYHEVEKVAAVARECYAEDAALKEMREEDFTRMMFLDGCFFLQFIKDEEGIQMMSMRDRVYVERDLYLLENQLPFIVLKALSGLSSDSELVEKMVNFINKWPHPPLEKEQSSGMMDFNCCLWCNPQRKREQSNAEREREPSKTQGEPIHLLQLLRQSLLNLEDLQGKQSGGSRGGGGSGFLRFHTYRSATELKKVGIHFRKSQSHRFTDVRFRKNLVRADQLRLPPMYVDDYTKSRLLNLAAYEMCADVPAEDPDVTSYVCLLDDMIDSAEDVKELRSHGILINYLGSDQQVVDLFDEIAKDLVKNSEVYASVNQQIEKRYKNKFKRRDPHMSWCNLVLKAAAFASSSSGQN